jgi:hypothetical protein
MLDGARWFRASFEPRIAQAIAGTPLTIELLTAVAIQESYEIWGRIFNELPVDEVLALCVGDVIGAPRRTVFPKTKEELLAEPDGDRMFAIAHEALVAMAEHAKEYQKYAANPERFCHAFGIFQYDIQFFRGDPAFFLEKRWGDFDACLSRATAELLRVVKKTFGAGKQALTDLECAYVGIGYNTGHVNINAGLKQGFKDDTGKFYGEYVAEYLQVARDAAEA